MPRAGWGVAQKREASRERARKNHHLASRSLSSLHFRPTRKDTLAPFWLPSCRPFRPVFPTQSTTMSVAAGCRLARTWVMDQHENLQFPLFTCRAWEREAPRETSPRTHHNDVFDSFLSLFPLFLGHFMRCPPASDSSSGCQPFMRTDKTDTHTK